MTQESQENVIGWWEWNKRYVFAACAVLGILILLCLCTAGGTLYYTQTQAKAVEMLSPTTSTTNPSPSEVTFTVTPISQAATPSSSNVITTTGDATATEHWARLEELDPVFRTQGWEAWLQAAGMTWDSIRADARQIEEETSPEGRILASGLQVDAVNLWVPWSNIVTTDTPSRITETTATRKHQPDLRNRSTLYTNVWATGPVTVWIDGSNWGQLLPAEAEEGPATTPTSSPKATATPMPRPTATTAPTPTAHCLTLSELGTLGEIITELYYPEGVLAGAQIKFQTPWTAPPGWTIHREGQKVNSVQAGDTASVWSDEACRPLAR